jgi:hypothetical protein
MEAGSQVSNCFEEREITRLEWTTDIEASQIIHIDLYAAHGDWDTNGTEFIFARTYSAESMTPDALPLTQVTKRES